MKVTELSIGKQQVIHEPPYIAFVNVEQDECVSDENPLDASGAHIISLGRRHSNFDPEAFEKLRKNMDNVVLGYYGHGNCLWYVSGETPPGADCPWDGVPVAGLWVAPPHFAADHKSLSKKERRAKALEFARHDTKVYTAWCNGEVYYYDVNVFEARHHEESGALFDDEDDYRHDKPVVEDSCGGFYIMDSEDEKYVLDQINACFKELNEPAQP